MGHTLGAVLILGLGCADQLRGGVARLPPALHGALGRPELRGGEARLHLPAEHR